MKHCENLCVNYHAGDPHTPPKDVNLATMEPFVEITIGPNKITTGNINATAEGTVFTASVLNFEFGCTGAKGNGGGILKATIIDEDGSALHKFLEYLFICITKTDNAYKFGAKWGWCGRKGCENEEKTIEVDEELRLSLADIQVSFDEGKVKYELTGTDLGPLSIGGRIVESWGDENKPEFLKIAIEKLGREVEPKWETEFEKFEDGKVGFNPAGGISPENGPQGIWRGKQTSKIQVIRNWLNSYTTFNKKGFIVVWNWSKKTPILRIAEVPDVSQSKTLTLGTFFVNAGDCSTVISFSANFNYIPGMVSMLEGGALEPQTGKEAVAEPKYIDGSSASKEQKTAGLSSSTIVDENAQANYTDTDAGKQVNNANLLNSKFSSHGVQPITAEMRIIGNPSRKFVYPLYASPAVVFCAVVVVNPFKLTKKSDCPVWEHGLAASDCNSVLSNTQWMVDGIHHQISAGNYTTTIALSLTTPGIDIPPGDMGNGTTLKC